MGPNPRRASAALNRGAPVPATRRPRRERRADLRRGRGAGRARQQRGDHRGGVGQPSAGWRPRAARLPGRSGRGAGPARIAYGGLEARVLRAFARLGLPPRDLPATPARAARGGAVLGAGLRRRDRAGGRRARRAVVAPRRVVVVGRVRCLRGLRGGGRRALGPLRSGGGGPRGGALPAPGEAPGRAIRGRPLDRRRAARRRAVRAPARAAARGGGAHAVRPARDRLGLPRRARDLLLRAARGVAAGGPRTLHARARAGRGAGAGGRRLGAERCGAA